MEERKIQTAFRFTPLQLKTIDELAGELGLNRTEFIAWMLDVVIVNWNKLTEAEGRRKITWEKLQDPKLKLDLDKYMIALREFEESLKIA